MAGILDNKSRIMDVIVTREGKRQIGSGDLKVAYASFTDNGTFYDKSSVSGSFDEAVNRLYFEATSLAFDQITIEKDDNGAVIPFAATPVSYNGQENRVYAVGGNITADGSILPNAYTPEYAALANGIIKNTTQNFRKQMIIASRDPIDDSETFDISTNSITFNYGNRGPIVGDDLVTTVDQAASVFTSKRFSNSVNFMFMPPIAKTQDGDVILGDYTDVRQVEEYTYKDVMNDLVGRVPDQPVCPNEEVRFTNTSQTNDICIQAFEIGENLKKLDMVDFGDHRDQNNVSKRIVFLGKNFVDSYGATNFINIFTLVIE